ncbi:hypothetical protein AMTR_s00033p00105920 [Amborella trichopoda]|uniref:Uncharacterized protein n=1 Tax=Amborella trichopoda TaxID=13333 RepID=U5CW88_AMBTC|nr:hypothetical protein AMTR_s00033p00105920 [Amborella trichopoda]
MKEVEGDKKGETLVDAKPIRVIPSEVELDQANESEVMQKGEVKMVLITMKVKQEENEVEGAKGQKVMQEVVKVATLVGQNEAAGAGTREGAHRGAGLKFKGR